MAGPGVVYNEALWAVFLERASMMELQQLPPKGLVMKFTGEVDLQALVGGQLHPALEHITLRSGKDLLEAASSPEHQPAGSAHSDAGAGQQQQQQQAVLVDASRQQQQQQQAVVVDASRQPHRCVHPLAGGRWQRFFSLFLLKHDPSRLPRESLFCGRAVRSPGSLAGAYAQFALAQAARDLLAAALQEPLNLQFLLLSEASVPLRPPELMWAQLVWEAGTSRVHSCSNDTHFSRWNPAMETSRLKHWHWHKSSQWVSLTRAHAALAAADRHVAEVFRRYCYTGTAGLPEDRRSRSALAAAAHAQLFARSALVQTHWEDIKGCRFASSRTLLQRLVAGREAAGRGGASAGGMHMHAEHPQQGAGAAADKAEGEEEEGYGTCQRFVELLESLSDRRICVADEHYLPVLLASYHLQNETDCRGDLHQVEWDGWHPYTFRPEDFTTEISAPGRFTNAMRHETCDGGAAMRSLQRLFRLEGGGEHGAGAAGGGAAAGASASGAPCEAHGAYEAASQTAAEGAASGSGGSAAGQQQQQGPARAVAGEAATLREWLEGVAGYRPMDAVCPLALRKVPADAAQAALRYALACDGLRLGPGCSWD